MKIAIVIIIYVAMAIWVYKTEGIDKDGVYHRSGSDSRKAGSLSDYLGRIAYAAIAPFIVAAAIGYLLGIK